MVLDEVRERIRVIEASRGAKHGHLPFGVDVIDNRLPGGGLALGTLHEIAGGGNGAVDGAAAALFAAGIMARTTGQVLWCVTRKDLYAPAIAQAALHPDRIVYAEVGDEKMALACFEDGLRHGGLAGVVGEVAKLPMMACRYSRSRRCASRSNAPGSHRVRPTNCAAPWQHSSIPAVCRIFRSS